MMRSCCSALASILLSLSLLVAARAHGAALAPAPAPTPTPPGADAFLGCKKYPSDKKFKWSVRGEVGVAELAASLGELSCRPIVVAGAILQRGGKVALEVPDLVTAADVYRLFYGALEAMGLTVDSSGGALKIVDAGRAPGGRHARARRRQPEPDRRSLRRAPAASPSTPAPRAGRAAR